MKEYEHIIPMYKELLKDVGSVDHCIFHNSSRNRNREIGAMEESYLSSGCKYLCAGQPFNGLPVICPDYLTVRQMFDELGLDVGVLEEKIQNFSELI